MLTELCTTRSTQATAFSYFAFFGNIGMFLGPLIGGVRADSRLASVLSAASLSARYPYAVPATVTGAIGLSAAMVSLLFVDETLPDRPQRVPGVSRVSDSRKPTILSIVNQPGVRVVLCLYSFGNLLVFAFTSVQPVHYFTSVQRGGFGLSSSQIAILLGINGFAACVWLLAVFPVLHRRIGTVGTLRISSYLFPPFFLSFSLLNFLLRFARAEDSQGARIAFWVLAPTSLGIGVGISMAFTALQLALNDVIPNPEATGLLNGIALSLVSAVRSFSPAMFTSIYAVGVKDNIAMGQLLWIIAIVLAIGFCVLVRYLPENAFGLPEKSSTHNDDRTEEA